ncbi:BTAD domain-containing putative transcriptional regulator [Streptomyces sp. NPDC051993]|uniref:ATP-binding protein n=1 Tax=Streptomyces sp. NPDC051993 TaxID=3155286 RepID=UPI00341E6534
MRYLILGVTEARDDTGTAVPLGGPRVRALLAALALHPARPVPVSALIDDIWADDPPQDAPAALQALVGRLRRVLGRTAVESGPAGYQLAAVPHEIDLYAFEERAAEGAAQLAAGDPESAARTLRAALALWRGPALADLPERDAAARPEAQRRAALRNRIEADLRRGATAPLLAELTELLASHPYDETLHAQLIRTLRAEGRRADALAAYETTRRTLADSLGTDPGPELAALHAELLEEPPAAPAPPTATGNIRPRLTSFVGREPELAWIQEELRTSRLVTLTGPGGTGKTRLAERAASETLTTTEPDRMKPGRAPGFGVARVEFEQCRRVSGSGTEPMASEKCRPASGSGAAPVDSERARPVSAAEPDRIDAGRPRRALVTSAWLVELASLEQPQAVPGAVVSALGLRETTLLVREGQGAAPDDPTARLIDDLSRRPSTLLVLDNCEHVIDAAARLAETLLTHCPNLRILATSREPLGVPGEAVRPVGPLPPAPAHRLFAERARTVRPGFDPGADPEAVAEICRRLDGLPLAIELAAARLRMLTARQIADRLDDRFRLLTSGSRTVLPRQQTLRAVVDWSWDLLDEPERTVLRRASVFAGGWDLAAAQAVCGSTDDLAALVDKSLVIAVPADDGSGMRYRMLETIHEYAAERAAQTPETLREAADAHTAYYRELALRAEPHIRAHEQLPWIRRVETDLDNIRAALRRTTTVAAGTSAAMGTGPAPSAPRAPSAPATGTPGSHAPSELARDEPFPDELVATELALAMGWFWWLRDYRAEGVAWTRAIAALSPAPSDERDPRYWPRLHLDLLHYFLLAETASAEELETPAAKTRLGQLRAVFEAGGPQASHFPGLLWPFTAFLTDTPYGLRELVDAVVANCRRHGDDWALSVALMFRAHLTVDTPGGLDGIDADLAELRELGHRVGDRWVRAQVAGATAEAAMMRGRPEQARSAYEEALHLAREVGAHHETPFLTTRLGELAYRTGDTESAEKSLAEAEAEAERYRTPDALPYIHSVLAAIALDRGDTPTARALSDRARNAGRGGPVHAHFTASLGALNARVIAAESAPAAGLRELTDVLRTAAGAECPEGVLAHLAECAARFLADLGEHARAVRVLAAATAWRAGIPRSAPELAMEESVTVRARRALTPETYETEHDTGTALTPPEIPPLLEAAIPAASPAP